MFLSPNPTRPVAASVFIQDDDDFDNFGGAEDAQAIIDAGEAEFMADLECQDSALGIDFDRELLKTPNEAMLRHTSMIVSPSEYFRSKAPSMGSLTGLGERPTFYSPMVDMLTPSKPSRTRRRLPVIESPFVMLKPLLKPGGSPLSSPTSTPFR